MTILINIVCGNLLEYQTLPLFPLSDFYEQTKEFEHINVASDMVQ